VAQRVRAREDGRRRIVFVVLVAMMVLLAVAAGA
jgi:hypothetical protein